MFLKKEVILLGVLLSLRIIFTIVQILIDYKILHNSITYDHYEN